MDIQVSQIIFQLINFSVVVGGVTYLLHKPILKILEERSSRIEAAQKAARETLLERERITAEEETILKKAREQASSIVEKGRQTAKEIEAQATSDGEKKAKQAVAKLKEQWEQERTAELTSMKVMFVDAVIASTQKVIATQLDAKKHQQIIDQELEVLLKKI